ncbi:MAG: hypothetical protein K2N89_00445 [Lachnospiraceae bacterium]|nr:hypothetical protein [Lachnospiraceae bacterium]
MITRWHILNIAVVLSVLFILSGCGYSQEQEKILPSVEMQETDFGESEYYEGFAAEEETIESTTLETLPEMPTEENGLMEIYAGGDRISVSEDSMIAQVSPQELLTGNPILYDRFRIDGWIFEWLISDYDDNSFFEDAVLVVSREDNAKDVQIIHVEAEGGYATWVSVENKFEYVDVNFDNIPDLLICTGHHGNQGLLTYYCFLQTEDGFVEAPTFTDISNPSIDVENELILSQWRNSAASHSWAEYQCRNNIYVRYRELREDAIGASEQGADIWIWTVNGEEIGRSDALSMEEIEDLLYNENSEWGILGDRWRTLYNAGLTADFSIYSEP